MKKLFKLTSLFMAVILFMQAIPNFAEAATRIYWNKKMIDGSSILYWVDSNVSYTTAIRNAEKEIEIPAAGYSNPMKMSKTTTKSSSKIEFWQINNPNITAIARSYSYRPNSSTAMVVTDKDKYNWYWCKIELNQARMKDYTPSKRATIIVHEMLHAFGGKDTYSSDQKSSIMYGTSDGTATGVTKDANNFLNDKY